MSALVVFSVTRPTRVVPKSSSKCAVITKKKFSVMLSNVRSIRKHHEDLETLIGSLESLPSILCITETWLSDDDNPDCYAVKGYKPYAAANRSTRGGVR